ncbi:hypothetical protein B0H19DRAFT_1260632 [Mycena capillaripes]|nr:hypothetical protein B0H19DRAFT_1260632 [Mycena capillaripes]
MSRPLPLLVLLPFISSSVRRYTDNVPTDVSLSKDLTDSFNERMATTRILRLGSWFSGRTFTLGSQAHLAAHLLQERAMDNYTNQKYIYYLMMSAHQYNRNATLSLTELQEATTTPDILEQVCPLLPLSSGFAKK